LSIAIQDYAGGGQANDLQRNCEQKALLSRAHGKKCGSVRENFAPAAGDLLPIFWVEILVLDDVLACPFLVKRFKISMHVVVQF